MVICDINDNALCAMMVIITMVVTTVLIISGNDNGGSVGNNDYIKNLLYKILVLTMNIDNSGL